MQEKKGEKAAIKQPLWFAAVSSMTTIPTCDLETKTVAFQKQIGLLSSATVTAAL